MRRELLDQRHENRIEEDVAIFGMVDDVLDLLRKQARIDGVQDAAAAGHAVVQLEMAIAVPGQRGDALAMTDAQRFKRVGDPLRPRRDIAIVGAVKDPFGVA